MNIFEDTIKGIALGAFYGAQAALFGYLASEELPLSWKVILSKKFWETFSWTKALKTVALGATLGAISQGYGFVRPQDWSVFTEYTGLPQIPLSLLLNFANTAVVLGVDKLSKFVFRRTPLITAWNKFKDSILKLLTAQQKVKEVIEKASEEETKDISPA
jgi:hypothetical protein